MPELEVIPKNVSSKAAMAYKLSEEHLQLYRNNGYLIIRRLIDPAVLNEWREHFNRICNGLEFADPLIIVKDKNLVDKATTTENSIHKLSDIHLTEVFNNCIGHPVLLDVLAQVIGEDILVMNGMFFNKPPGTAAHIAHQDFYYAPYRPVDKMVGAWTAVDEATVNNGCLWVIPGSHKAGKLYQHAHVTGSPRQHHSILDESVSPPHKRVYLEMCPGDTLLLHPLVIHGSATNNSQSCRKSIVAHYISGECELEDLRGTGQAGLALELVELDALKRGLDMSYKTMWRNKSKQVRGTSKL